MVRTVQRSRSEPSLPPNPRVRVPTLEVFRSLSTVLWKMITGSYITQSNVTLYEKRATAILEREGVSFARKPSLPKTQ